MQREIEKTTGDFFSRKIVREISSYLFAVVLPLCPLAILLVLSPSPESVPAIRTLFFTPFIAIIAWYFGLRRGLVTTLVSTLIVGYFNLNPHFVQQEKIPENTALVTLFAVEGIFYAVLLSTGKATKSVFEYRKREKELNDQLQTAQTEIAISKKEIQSRDEFLSVASHELKTPLTSMLLQTQTALHNIKNVSLARFSIGDLLTMLESVENQTKRLSKMINDLLNISLITTGNMELEPEEVDARKLITDLIDDFSPRLKRENMVLTYDPQETALCMWDRVRIEQAISNLLSNAIKYGSHKPIRIKTERRHAFMRISVRDEGIGIPKDQQKKVFGLFERGIHNADFKGLGVGLFITEQIIKAHSGTIMLSSKEGRGSEFIIDLPILFDYKKA